jgi:transglutaminase-like putative cysteine protease
MSPADAAPMNARAARTALLVAGIAGQFAVMPVMSGLNAGIAMAALIAVGIATIRLPLPKAAAGARPGAFRLTVGVRQATALAIIVLGSVVVLARVNVFDANSKAAALATLLLVVQIAHGIALQTRREAALGCAIVLVMLSVGAAFAGDVTLLLPVLVALPAVAVTASLLHRGGLIEGADFALAGGAAAIVRACVKPVVLATVIGLVIFLALPNSGHLRTQSRFSTVSSGSATGLTPSGGSAGERSASNPGAGALDLRLRGTLSNEPMLEVPANSPLYWQSAVFSSFDGRRWVATGPFARWPLASSGAGTAQTAPPDSTEATNEIPANYTVRVLSRIPLDSVVGPRRPVGYIGPGSVVVDGSGTAHLVHGPVAGGDDTYTVISTSLRNQSDAALLASSGSDITDPQWLSLPADLPARVNALAASLASQEPSRFAAVNAIEDYLRTHEKYKLDSPLPARGDDAVDDFLFVSHQGFCEQYATAAVIMLRTQGIAARLVTGFVDGDVTSSPGRRVLHGKDAHAWVQVYYPGVGWVDSDPTAGTAAAASSTSLRQHLNNLLKTLWHSLPGGRLGAIVGVLLVLAFGIGLSTIGRRWARRRRRYAGVDRGRSNDGPVLVAYLRLDVALRGVERARAPSESFGEIAWRLGGLVASQAEVFAAVRCLERESYGIDPPSAGEADAAIEVFDRLRAAAGSQPVALAAAPAGRPS